MIEDYILNPQKLGNVSNVKEQLSPVDETPENNDSIGEPSSNDKKLQKSVSHTNLIDNKNSVGDDFDSCPTLSKSLGAKDFNSGGEMYLSDESLVFSDAEENVLKTSDAINKDSSVYVSAAISIDFPGAPNSSKYIR